MTKNPWLVPQADKMTDNAFRLKEELIEANSMSQQDKVDPPFQVERLVTCFILPAQV